ncbi:DUF11 domain-containing protein [Streptomonospora sp. S1-112]|uniref:DUF11 domain-containing protein n=1 Tax=Streptomonospora mangrovi TaxID=2883123 RepID=A0A9X3NIG2_9ACTN|nr:DUF11 domain-containing protein [Streptomonospora mangrovi]MDA0564292.1 DUF11 domain-containing protein [Streptomonospora mangrovi]
MARSGTRGAARAVRAAAALVLVAGWGLSGPAAAETTGAAGPVAVPDAAEAARTAQAPGAPAGAGGAAGAAGMAAAGVAVGAGAPAGAGAPVEAHEAVPPAEPAAGDPVAAEPGGGAGAEDAGAAEGAAEAPGTPAEPAAGTRGGEAAEEREPQVAGPLSLSKSVSPDPMVIGDTATYTITVTNPGDEPAEDVVVTDQLDPNVTFVSAPGCTAAGQTVTCGGAGTTVAPGESVTYTVTVRVDPGLADGTNITNRAEVASANAGSDSTQLISQTQTQTDVVIDKTADAATVNPDGTITYTITVTNEGPSEAVDVTVQDPTNGNLTTIVDLPPECPPSGLTVTCPLGTLQPGETVTLEFTVRVNDDVAEGTRIVNCATVYTGSRETTTENNDSCADTDVGPSVDAVTDIAVEKSAPATVAPGGELVYTVTVTDTGSQTASGVVLEDPIDTDLATVEELPEECRLEGSEIVCDLGDLQPGESRELTFVLRVDPGAEAGTHLANCAVGHTDTPETDADNNSACVDVAVEDGDPEPSPSPSPSPEPTPSPSPSPSPDPTGDPTPGPSPDPTGDPTPDPTGDPLPPGYGGDGDDDGYGDGKGDDEEKPDTGLPVTGGGLGALAALGVPLAGIGLALRRLAGS